MGSNARKRVHGGVVPNDIIRIFNDKVIGLSNLGVTEGFQVVAFI